MTGRREILVYPGSPKTGTSALQAVLRCSVAELKMAGWNYLHDPVEGDPVTSGSGNAVRLYAALAGASDRDPLEELEILAPAGERSILASEALGMLSVDQWSPVIDLLEAEGGTIRAVYCVRDLYPYLWSAHNQGTLGFGLSDGFDRTWVETPIYWKIRRDLLDDRYRKHLPESPCVTSWTFLHYETIRGDLVEQMLRAGGLPLEALRLDLTRPADRPINRSLTQPEVALMRQINTHTDGFRAEWCGLTLIQRPAPEPARPVYVPEVHAYLTETWQGEVDRFNDDLPPGTEWELKIFDESAYDYEEIDPHPEQSPEFADAIYYLLSFRPSDDLRDFLISLLPDGIYDPPPPPGTLRRVASRAKRALAPGAR